mgnify:CR=1 FL=1
MFLYTHVSPTGKCNECNVTLTREWMCGKRMKINVDIFIKMVRMTRMNKFIAVSIGQVYLPVLESGGWIFRQMDNPQFGMNGHFQTLIALIEDALRCGVVVHSSNKVVTIKNLNTLAL